MNPYHALCIFSKTLIQLLINKKNVTVITGNTFRVLQVVWWLRSIVQHSTVAEEGGFSKGIRESVYTEQEMVMCCCDSWWGSWMKNAGLWSWQDLKNGNVCWDRLKFGGGVSGTRKKNSSSAAKYFFFYRYFSTDKNTEAWNEQINELDP